MYHGSIRCQTEYCPTRASIVHSPHNVAPKQRHRAEQPNTEDLTVQPLTPGELRALQALARHENTKEAAAAIGITDRTLRNLISRGFKKLEVTNRTAAYRRLGWLRPPQVIT